MSEQEAKPEGGQGEEKSSLLSDILDVIETIFITIFVFILIFAYFLRTVEVDGTSMYPTLCDRDRMLVLNTFSTPKTGSIVVIDDTKGAVYLDPDHEVLMETQGLQIVIVKRVIARGGQEIDIDFDTGLVSVDGQVLSEKYTSGLTTRDEGGFTYPFTVPEGYVFVMGDNRSHSTDSRSGAVGLVPEDRVIGVAFWRYYRESDLCAKWTDRFGVLI